ncbi:MAG: hypothetical protein KGM44_02665 [bacterium]|nr:hypothetical protein [bacterium]
MSEEFDKTQDSWVVAHMGKSSQETAERLLTTPQERPPADAPLLVLRRVRARCVGSGSSNFWIIGHEAAEPMLDGEFPMIGVSPTAYFVRVPRFNYLPYAVPRRELDPANHEIHGDLGSFEAQMKRVYG